MSRKHRPGYAWMSDLIQAFSWDSHELLSSLVATRGRPLRPGTYAARTVLYFETYLPLVQAALGMQLAPSQARKATPIRVAIDEISQEWADVTEVFQRALTAMANNESLEFDTKALLMWRDSALALGLMLKEYTKTIDDAEIELPTAWSGRLAGFQIQIVVDVRGETRRSVWEADRLSVDDIVDQALKNVDTMFRYFRQRATRIFPWLLSHMTPLEIYFGNSRIMTPGGDSTLLAGDYLPEGRIRIYALDQIDREGFSLNVDLFQPQRLMVTLAHELGHHVWRNYLGEDSKQYWRTQRSLYAEVPARVPLKPVIVAWERSGYENVVDFLKSLEHSPNPRAMDTKTQLELILTAAMEAGSPITRRGDLHAILQTGVTSIPAPSVPITAYAETDAEEAFCEAFGLLFAYGPRRLPGAVRHDLQVMMPELRIADSPPLYGAENFE